MKDYHNTFAARLVLPLLLCAACDDGPGSRTIEPEGQPFDEMFRLVRVITPEQSPESPIVRISGTTWDGDRFAIADVAEGNAKVFDRDGSRIVTVGRTGEGPGEFQAARLPQFVNGALFVADGSLGRVSVWTESGDLDREIDFRVGHGSDFAVLRDGRILFSGVGLGRSGAVLAVFADDGNGLTDGLFIDAVLPADADPELPWGNMRQAYFDVVNDTAWAVSTISDSIWAVPLNADSLAPRSYRLAIPGYVPPGAPEKPLQSVRDLMEWGKSFHGAARPVASAELLAIPFVQGVLTYGDPTILVVRDGDGHWYALSDPPPVIAAFGDQLLVIHNPLEDPVELAVYEMRE